MLVLTRRTGQKIRVGESVVLTIIGCGNGRVRLGIEAPEEVAVFREEVLQKRTEAAASPRTKSRRPIKKS